MSENFNYKDFANELRFQVRGVVPENLKDDEKYIRDVVYEMSVICGEALCKEELINEQNCKYITQIIAEWTFHKTVDMLSAQIPKEYHNSILHKLNNGIYEYLTSVYNEFPSQDIIKQLEISVNKNFNSSLKNLLDKKIIDKTSYEKAVSDEYYSVPVSIYDVLKGCPYLSFLYIVFLPFMFINALICFHTHDNIAGSIFLVVFLIFLFRFLTRENNISVKL